MGNWAGAVLIGQLVRRRRNLRIGDGNDAKITTYVVWKHCLPTTPAQVSHNFLSKLSVCIWHAANYTSRVPASFSVVLKLRLAVDCQCQHRFMCNKYLFESCLLCMLLYVHLGIIIINYAALLDFSLSHLHSGCIQYLCHSCAMPIWTALPFEVQSNARCQWFRWKKRTLVSLQLVGARGGVEGGA